MMNTQKFTKFLIILFLVLMVLNPYASYDGASSGLLLWFHNVLPNLLPFIIISNLMIHFDITQQLSHALYPIFGKVFHISKNGCYPILFGFLSGMPMGAKSTADLLADNKISKPEGQFILSLCNNASPMFIIGYITINQLKLPHMKYSFFLIIYASAMISALLYRFIETKLLTYKNIPIKYKVSALSTTENTAPKTSFSFALLDQSIMNGFEVVTKIGGYIILFSILAQITNSVLPDIGAPKAIFMGLLEITTGINQLSNLSSISTNIKIVLVVAITSFGGLSGLAQTKSVLGDTGLSIASYLIVKFINVVISCLITSLYVSFFLG